MKIHGDVHLAAHTLAYRRKAVHNGVEHFQVIQRPDGRDDRIFYGSKTFGQTLVCNFQHFLHREIPGDGCRLQVAVHPHPVPAGTAQHFVDRHVVILAFDVPQSLLDAGDGTHEHRPSAVIGAAVHQLHQMLDFARVCTDQHRAVFFHSGGHGVCTTLHNGFAPAADALVGGDLQKQPARLQVEQLKICDLQSAQPPLVHGRKSIKIIRACTRRPHIGQGALVMP